MRAQTMPQHMRALNRAQDHRLARAEWKRTVAESGYAAGCALVASAIEEPPSHLRTMVALDALTVIWHMRRPYAQRLLHDAGIYDQQVTLRRLTVRQRLALAAALRGKAAR